MCGGAGGKGNHSMANLGSVSFSATDFMSFTYLHSFNFRFRGMKWTKSAIKVLLFRGDPVLNLVTLVLEVRELEKHSELVICRFLSRMYTHGCNNKFPIKFLGVYRCLCLVQNLAI